ncbi:hypothetical protein Tco_1251905 [Tanacetum coccineum]
MSLTLLGKCHKVNVYPIVKVIGQRASGSSDRDALAKFLQMGTVAEYQREAFSLARITEARFKDENNRAVDNNVGDQEDPNVNDKQDVKKGGNQVIENVKDKEGKNVEDQ